MQIIRNWMLVVTAVVLLVGCSAGGEKIASYTSELRGAVFNPAREIADFTATSTTGETFTLSEHRGEIVLLYFGYRSCPDFCPTTFTELRRVYAELNEPADKLKVIFVTIDPERDTLDAMSLYTQGFHEDFIGLRAEGQALQQLEDQFGVVAKRQVVGESALSYLFDHTASVFLIGANGQLEAQYLYGTDYRDIVHDLRLIFQAL